MTIYPSHDAPFPGIAERDRARLNREARDALRAAIDAHKSLCSLVLVLRPEGATVQTRREVAVDLRAAGVFTLARKVERSRAPLGTVLLLVEVEGVTELGVVSLASLAVHPQPTPTVFRVGIDT